MKYGKHEKIVKEIIALITNTTDYEKLCIIARFIKKLLS